MVDNVTTSAPRSDSPYKTRNAEEREVHASDSSLTVGETFLSETFGAVDWESGWTLVSNPVSTGRIASSQLEAQSPERRLDIR